MSISTLSAPDRALLAILGDNAREPVATIARRLGLSRTTVQAKIERLERDGIITGYGVRLSDDFVQAQVKAHVMITLLPKALPKVSARLHAIQEVLALHSVSGGHDLIAIVAAPTIGALDSVIDEIGQLEGVERTHSAIILSTRFERAQSL